MKPISTDEELVNVLDELKFNIGAGFPYSPMRLAFNELLNSFIKDWGLDSDPNAFASLPKLDSVFKFNVGDKVKIDLKKDSDNIIFNAEIVRRYSILDKNIVINRYVVEIDRVIGSEVDILEADIQNI